MDSGNAKCVITLSITRKVFLGKRNVMVACVNFNVVNLRKVSDLYILYVFHEVIF